MHIMYTVAIQNEINVIYMRTSRLVIKSIINNKDDTNRLLCLLFLVKYTISNAVTAIMTTISNAVAIATAEMISPSVIIIV